ncbi:MAG: hypothetical protein R3C12_19280 [Planctomycetaceae bacterium]
MISLESAGSIVLTSQAWFKAWSKGKFICSPVKQVPGEIFFEDGGSD